MSIDDPHTPEDNRPTRRLQAWREGMELEDLELDPLIAEIARMLAEEEATT